MDADALLADLDPDQRAAVTAESQLVAVIAGAGSGKTRVLTRRIAHRVAVGSALAQHTLALTFTREAAGELRRRLARLGIRDRVEAGTFHSVMLGVLTQRWQDTDRRPRTVVPDRRRLVGDAIEGRRGLDGFVAEIDWAAARNIGADRYPQAARRSQRRPVAGVERCGEVYAAYEALKRRRGIVDFDDVLALVIADMERDTAFADTVRWRFRHVLVDEAQDLNPLQHRLVDLLRAGRDDLFLVGDPAQAIYGFNGADPGLLVDVETRFPGVEIVRLPVNHRCTPQIVRAAAHVLQTSEQPSDLRSSRGDGPSVEHVVTDDEAAEAARVAGEVVHLDQNLVRAREIAVLARTNAQLGPFEDALQAMGIAVRRSATAAGSPLQTAIRRAGGLGSASQLRAWAHDTLDAAEAARTGSDDADEATARRPGVDLDAERRVAEVLLAFLRDQPLGDGAGFRAWVAMTNPFDDRSAGGVELLTFHSAKGREWHTVFVTGVESSLVPHKSATTTAARAEEARLLYVAMTRATDRLVLTGAARRAGYARTVSPLIANLDLLEAPALPPPSELRRDRQTVDPLLVALRSWREEAARVAGVLPAQLCSDRDLAAIATQRPTTRDDLVAATTLGVITASRLGEQILPLVADAPKRPPAEAAAQSTSSTTGA